MQIIFSVALTIVGFWTEMYSIYLNVSWRSSRFSLLAKQFQMFKGNVDADTIKYNVFEVPIIAQWVRINPTRWRDRISMRVELYGCEYGRCFRILLSFLTVISDSTTLYIMVVASNLLSPNQTFLFLSYSSF